jgi:hypothetical protein
VTREEEQAVTWSLNASGHAESAEKERELVDQLRAVFASVEGAAFFYGQYSRHVDLHAEPVGS